MPSSSRRDYKQHSSNARPNHRRNNKLTAKQNPLVSMYETLAGWFIALPRAAKVLLPIGILLLAATLFVPDNKIDATNNRLALSADVESPKQNFQVKEASTVSSAKKTAGNKATENKDAVTDFVTISMALPERAIQKVNSSENIASDEFNPDISQVTLTIDKGDTLGELFTKNNLSYSDMLSILKNKTAKQYLTRIKPNEDVIVQRKEISDDESDSINYSIKSLAYQINIEEELNVTRSADNSFNIEVIKTPLERRAAHAHGTINDSLFLAGQASGLNDNTIMNMAGIFQWDVDFIQDIRKGDSFTVIYEQLFKNGERVGNGEILAAEFHNNGDDFHAIRFVDETGDSNYYAPSGKSMKKAFLRAPIAINPRVTSSFNPRRFHPVHKRVRPHRGVDYGGPLNTPILAAGDGKVIFRGRKGGYGRCVIIQHGGNITTLYAHLNKFNSKVKNGSRVKQGQTIGYLGASGTVTAKHLHYEYRLNGTHRNPRTVKLPNAKALPKKYKTEFDKVKTDYMAQLDTIKRAYTLNADNETKVSDAVITASSSSAAGQ